MDCAAQSLPTSDSLLRRREEQVLPYNNVMELSSSKQLSPSHPWIRIPLLCNAGGSVRDLHFKFERDEESCIIIFDGLWMFEVL